MRRLAQSAVVQEQTQIESVENAIPADEFVPQTIDVNDLDIPAFLRRR
jgi:hypothetical protein